jgi:hypothetical protein
MQILLLSVVRYGITFVLFSAFTIAFAFLLMSAWGVEQDRTGPRQGTFRGGPVTGERDVQMGSLRRLSSSVIHASVSLARFSPDHVFHRVSPFLCGDLPGGI